MPDKLSKKAIEAALAAGTGGKPYVMLWDTTPTGLGLRIRQSGNASWLYRYRPKDALRGQAVKTLTLGTWPLLSVEGARTLALGHAAKIAIGGDPGVEIQQQKLRERSTVNAALEDYELALNRRHIVNRKTVMTTLRRGFTPVLGQEIDTLGLRDVVTLIDRIASAKRRRKDGTVYVTPGAAADFRKLAHGFLGWAALQGLVKSNVLAGFRSPKQSREERRTTKARQGRALDDREIAALWRASLDKGSFGALVRAGLLTGLRRSELAGLRRSDIEGETIIIPESRAKTGREHRVPVSTAMRALLTGQPGSARRELIFPSAVSRGVMSGWSKLVPKLVETSGVRFRLHDLRRTCRTLMSRLGIAEPVAEAAIGHTRGGLVAIYDRHDLWEERIRAFELVSDHIRALVEGDDEAKSDGNVVPLRSR